MIYCVGQQCTLEVACQAVESVMVIGDSLPAAFRMQHRIGDVWFALLILPIGRHTFRYIARVGAKTLCVGHDTVSVGDGPFMAELNRTTKVNGQ